MAIDTNTDQASIDHQGNAHFLGGLRVDGKVRFTVTGVSTTTYTALDGDVFINATATSARIVTIPDAGAVGQRGKVIAVKDGAATAASANVTVKATGGTLDGVAAGTGLTISTTSGCLVLIGDGTNWNVLAKF